MSADWKGPREIIGLLLRNARARSDLTIREASKLLGMTPVRVSEIECGVKDFITVPEIEAYAKLLRIDTGEINP